MMNQMEIKRRQAEEIADILMLLTIFILGKRMADGGITYMTAAVSVCVLMGAAVSGRLADTLGRLLRSRRNKGQYKNILKMRRSALLFSVVLGLAGTLVLMVAAGGIAKTFFKISYGTFVIMALAPIILLRTISSVLQGFFQGEASEMPRAAASILRQILTLGFGLFFCNITGNYGAKISALLREDHYTAMYSCLGIALAICLAEVFVILFLTVLFKGSRGNERKRNLSGKMNQDGMYTGDSTGDCIMSICAGRWPGFVTELLLFLPLAMGLAVFSRRIWEEQGTVFEYDIYVGRYLVVCGVLYSLISILVLPVMGRIFQYFRKEESRFARVAFQGGIHICLVHGIFISIYAAVMGTQISGFLGGGADQAGQMLQRGSAVIAFASLSFCFTGFLQMMGKKYFLLGAVGIADIIFAATVLITSKQGILALIYGGVAALFVLCILSGVFSCRLLRIQIDWLNILILPSGAGGIAGLLCMLTGRIFAGFLGHLPVMLISFFLCGTVYWILLILLHNFKDAELEVIPGGRLISMIGQKMHLY